MGEPDESIFVSTHSRPKAAGLNGQIIQANLPICFNSQPPEGGWSQKQGDMACKGGFNSQPPEGGWPKNGRA